MTADATAGALIEARDVQLSFGQTPALRGASMAVAAGEIVAVMGPSGSGKSTLLHCLAGILVPDAGEIHFAGRRVDTLREQERSALRRDRFGFVFQFGQLVPELSAEENVALPLLIGALVSAAAGLFAARLVLRAQLKEVLRAPDGTYYVVVVVGLALSMAVIASVLPLLRRMTGPETARND